MEGLSKALSLRMTSRNFIWTPFQCPAVPSLSYASASDDTELLSSDLSSTLIWKCCFVLMCISFYWFRSCLNWLLTSFLCSLSCGSYKYKYMWQDHLEFILSLFLDIVPNKFMFKHLVCLYLFARREKTNPP